MMRSAVFVPLAAFGLAFTTRKLLVRSREIDLRGKVALVTGGSRGLGLALARELAGQGCRVALCARDAGELERARRDVDALGADVLASVCDVADRDQVHQLVESVRQRFGDIDVLINNAGLMSVGPLETQTLADFERAMAVMFWGAVYPTLEVLPSMRARRAGRIATITSIGGKISVPHMLPYSSAKFAAVGFSEGLRAELAREGIYATTVVPGLMRTGSHVNAEFKGQHRLEYAWFSLAASLPVTSIAAEAAARQIVGGIQRGEAEIFLSWQASVAARIHGLMPGLVGDVLAIVDRLLPSPGGVGAEAVTGKNSQSAISESPLVDLGRQAASRFNQL